MLYLRGVNNEHIFKFPRDVDEEITYDISKWNEEPELSKEEGNHWPLFGTLNGQNSYYSLFEWMVLETDGSTDIAINESVTQQKIDPQLDPDEIAKNPKEYEVIKVPSKTLFKFQKCYLRYFGPLDGAIRYLHKNLPWDTPINRVQLSGGHNSVFVGGSDSRIHVGDWSTIKVGQYSEVRCGYGCSITAGEHSEIIVKHGGKRYEAYVHKYEGSGNILPDTEYKFLRGEFRLVKGHMKTDVFNI
jgi:hypothetical protein